MSEPDTQAVDTLRLVPLGGLGEIGMNMMALESGNDLLLIDCGVMFPEPAMLGVDLVLPDISWLAGRSGDIRGLVLTHGHEDHIGALPYLLEALGNPPVYGTALTLGLVGRRLQEHGLEKSARLHTVEPRQRVDLPPFSVEFFRAAHSIADGVGLAIHTPAGLVVHTGDFKLDPTPVDGERTDLARLAACGEEGVLLLLSDSTNVENKGVTLSERTVGEAFDEIIPQCSGRILVAAFASNLHRLQQAIDSGIANGRKIALNGRSLISNVAIARHLGYLKIADTDLVDIGKIDQFAGHEVLILTTGSQGEPLSALSRIAMDDHKQIRIEQDDTVILSSKFIPGNEKAISSLINHLYRRGAEVIYEKTSEIHVSGHASQEELKTMIALTRPQYFVPIHGEYRHLVKHAQLARTMGVPTENAIILENGQPLRVSANGADRQQPVESGRVFVDGKSVGDIGFVQLRDRSHLANHGLVVAVLGIHPQSGELVYGPELMTRGLLPEEDREELLERARQTIREMLEEHSLGAIGDREELRAELRGTLRRFFNRNIARRPLIVPLVFEP
ncbi:MAG: ribonuclease J [Desulfuromonadales bacterium]